MLAVRAFIPRTYRCRKLPDFIVECSSLLTVFIIALNISAVYWQNTLTFSANIVDN